MNFRERCKKFNERLSRNAMLRQSSAVDDIAAFVMSETGRSADQSLENTHALVLYFGSEDDREEFIAVVRKAKPGMLTKKMP